MKVSKDGLGRFQGTLREYWNFEDEHYVDYKESVINYPIHNQYDASECITYKISELKSK